MFVSPRVACIWGTKKSATRCVHKEGGDPPSFLLPTVRAVHCSNACEIAWSLFVGHWYLVCVLTERQQLGLLGERVAARWLRRHGWIVLAHRFRDGHRDIDLVVSHVADDAATSGDAHHDGRLVSFVEVRTRRGTWYGTPVESVGWRKRRELVRSARSWVASNKCSKDSYRFDVVGVLVTGQKVRIQYVPNAFSASWFG